MKTNALIPAAVAAVSISMLRTGYSAFVASQETFVQPGSNCSPGYPGKAGLPCNNPSGLEYNN